MKKFENIFEAASRLKFRFPYTGQVAVEDLWDLKVEELDKIFKTLNSEKKHSEEESLLSEKSDETVILDTKIEIIKYIVNEKQKQKETALKAKEDRDKKQKIMAIIEKKRDEKLENTSIEELEKMLAEM